jgi:outer membrane protein TolC
MSPRLLVLAFLLARAAHAAESLSLVEAAELALARQPLLEAQRLNVAAAEQSAIAASQLPDPKLKLGLRDYPITGSDAFSLTRDNFTMLTLGIAQDFPREAKRRLKGERGDAESARALAELEVLRRNIRRDAALAWLDLYQPIKSLELIQSLQKESALKLESLEIGLKAGDASLAQVLAEQVNLQVLKDREAELANQAERARAALSRWIGSHANRAIEAELPEIAPPALEEIAAHLEFHPHLNTFEEQTRLAETEVALARQGYKPDWSLEFSYGVRPEFSDFVGVQASIDLPVFPRNRQDRELAAKLATVERARALRDDQLRVMRADAQRYINDWRSATNRLGRFYDGEILPRAKERIEAALAAYRTGRADLQQVLDARQAELQLRLQKLALETDRVRAAQQLLWLFE